MAENWFLSNGYFSVSKPYWKYWHVNKKKKKKRICPKKNVWLAYETEMYDWPMKQRIYSSILYNSLCPSVCMTSPFMYLWPFLGIYVVILKLFKIYFLGKMFECISRASSCQVVQHNGGAPRVLRRVNPHLPRNLPPHRGLEAADAVGGRAARWTDCFYHRKHS